MVFAVSCSSSGSSQPAVSVAPPTIQQVCAAAAEYLHSNYSEPTDSTPSAVPDGCRWTVGDPAPANSFIAVLPVEDPDDVLAAEASGPVPPVSLDIIDTAQVYYLGLQPNPRQYIVRVGGAAFGVLIAGLPKDDDGAVLRALFP